MSKTLDRLAARFPDRIESYEHDEDGWWIWLRDGWEFDGEVSFVHEDTVAECVTAFGRVVWTGQPHGSAMVGTPSEGGQ